jgi:organic hydroperoxide reductase OsmC/OhrA
VDDRRAPRARRAAPANGLAPRPRASLTERASHTHRYTARLSWRGSTAEGYRGYDREHEAQAPPAEPTLTLSADPVFRGLPQHLNPEQLVVIAAASRQALSFLALAAHARIDLREYHDQAEGVMTEDDPPVGIERIALRPRITVASGAARERVTGLVELAHPRVLHRQLGAHPNRH